MSRYTGAEAHAQVTESPPRLFVCWQARDATIFTRIKDDFRATFPPPTAVWVPERRAWSVPLVQRRHLEDWLTHWFDAGAIQWAPDADAEPRYSSGGWTQGQSSNSQSRAGATERGHAVTTLDAAYQTLFVVPTAPECVVRAAYRALVQDVHPDRGGSHERAVALNTAMEVIRAHRSAYVSS